MTVDDAALLTGRFDDGVLGTFGASRMATGSKNALQVEISGSLGALRFDLETPNYLDFYDTPAPRTAKASPGSW